MRMYTISVISEGHQALCHHLCDVADRCLEQLQVQPCVLELEMCDDNRFVALNVQLRGRDELEDLMPIRYDHHHAAMGRIVINLAQVKRDVMMTDTPLTDYLDGLLVHGLLHVLGYDHMERTEGFAWENLQNNLLSLVPSANVSLD